MSDSTSNGVVILTAELANQDFTEQDKPIIQRGLNSVWIHQLQQNDLHDAIAAMAGNTISSESSTGKKVSF